MGLDGKTLIHPEPDRHRQRGLRADDGRNRRRARRSSRAFDLPENAGKGVIQLDGRMVERLHAEMARRTLSIAAGHRRLGTRRRPGETLESRAAEALDRGLDGAFAVSERRR